MRKDRIQIITILFIIISLFVLCTKNPFFNDDEIVSKDIIKGSVILGDGATPNNVLVWFEQNGITTRTDSTGHFKLQLPVASSQEGGGWTGQYTCFFYLAGYLPDSVQVWIREGNVQWGKGAIDDKGKMRGSVLLRKQLKTSLSFDPDFVFIDYVGDIQGTLTLQALDDPVVVKIPFMFRNTTITRYILNQQDITEGYPKFITLPFLTGATENYFPLNPGESVSLVLPVSWPPVAGREFWTYPSGNYTVTPFFWIEPEGIPEAMADHVNQYLQFDTSYFEYPLHHTPGLLTVSPDSMMHED